MHLDVFLETGQVKGYAQDMKSIRVEGEGTKQERITVVDYKKVCEKQRENNHNMPVYYIVHIQQTSCQICGVF